MSTEASALYKSPKQEGHFSTALRLEKMISHKPINISVITENEHLN